MEEPTRQQQRRAKKLSEKQHRNTGRVAQGIHSVMLIQEAQPFRVRMREAWRILTKHRTRMEAANRKALGYDA